MAYPTSSGAENEINLHSQVWRFRFWQLERPVPDHSCAMFDVSPHFILTRHTYACVILKNQKNTTKNTFVYLCTSIYVYMFLHPYIYPYTYLSVHGYPWMDIRIWISIYGYPYTHHCMHQHVLRACNGQIFVELGK